MMNFWFDAKMCDHKTLLNRYEVLKKDAQIVFAQMQVYQDFYEMENQQIYVVENSVTSNRGYYSSYNVIRSIINAMHSRIGSKHPRPMFLTDDASFETRQKAKNNDKIVNYQMRMGKANRACKQAFKLACICNLGVVKVICKPEKKAFKYESVHPMKIFVPSPKHGLPDRSEIFQEYYIPHSMLVEMFPDKEKEIMDKAETYRMDDGFVNSDDYTKENGALVVEAWKAGKKHVIFMPDVNDCILFEEKWDYDFIPFAFYRWETKAEGFYGQGLAEELTPIQKRINYITRKIMASLDLVAGSRIMIQGNIEEHKSKITNQIGSIIRYTGENPPFESIFQGVPESYFRDLQQQIDFAIKQSGLSELTITSQKPKGLNSGKALQTYHDIETQRFAHAAREYSDMYLDIARMTHKMGIKNRLPMFEKFKDKEKPYIDVYPTNMLSDHPSGRYEDLEKLINMGVVPAGQVTQLLEFPDLKAFETQESATIKAISEHLSMIINEPEGEGVNIDPFEELDLNIQMITAKKVLADLIVTKAKDYQIKRVRDFINETKGLINAKLQATIPDVPEGNMPGQSGDPQGGRVPNSPEIPQA